MSWKVLANDGIDAVGKEMLEKAGLTVDTNKIPQNELKDHIGNYDVIIVRSATKVNAEVIDAGSNLKLIARAGVGLDNIDTTYAGKKGIPVVNTPGSSTRSVAELVFAHLSSAIRFLHKTNRELPLEPNGQFNELKKIASKGVELKGKTLGIVGFGRIGQEVARMAIGLGMEVKIYDYKERDYELTVTFHPAYAFHNFQLTLKSYSLKHVLEKSDFISLHVPGGDGKALIGEEELSWMKKGAVIVNCSRGGVVDESALKAALNSGHIAFAGLDVFEQEPPVYTEILQHPNVSVSPHIGASTVEAQLRVGIELAERILSFIK